MELDELKNTWMVLEQQLKKNETLNQQLLLEMAQKKSNKSLNRLVNYDFLGIILMFLFLPFGIWIYNANRCFMDFLSVKMLAVTCISISTIGIVWYYYKLKHLMKIDFSKSVKDNIYGVAKYDVMIKQEKTVSYCILIPVLFFFAAYCYYEFNVTISLWAFLIACMIVGIILTFWSYKKIYEPNIQSIKKRLDEWKEVEDNEL